MSAHTEKLERWRKDAEKIKPGSAAAPIAKDLLRAIEQARTSVQQAEDERTALAHMSQASQLASDMYAALLRDMQSPK